MLGAAIPHLPKNAHVICSGNFSIEATLRLNGYKGTLTGSDVSLYTCTLGAYFAGQDVPLSMNLGDQQGRAAAVALALDMLAVYPPKNLYQQRMFRHYESNIEKMIEKTRAKLAIRKDALQLDAFYARDGWERVMEVPAGADDVIMTFPPTYEGGYEKLYKAIGALFIWHAPEYRMLTTGAEFVERLIQRDGPWVFGTEKRTPEIDAVLGTPYTEAPRDSQVKISLYSNIDELGPKVIRRSVSAEEPRWPRLKDTDVVTRDSKLTIHRIKSTEANYIRQVYASVEVGQASAQYSYAVAIDGKVIGILLFQEPTSSMKLDGELRADTIYMMADIAVSSAAHGRLSKLLLLAATSKEMRHDLESRSVREIGWNVTTAFSKHPVSMKYRGLFDLHSRKRDEEKNMYLLNYYAKMGERTLAEALTLWLTRYHQQ